ncbi:10269_t:CDS:1, partial [Gigaspora margarita]
YLSTKSGSSKEIASHLEDDLKGRSRRNRHPNWIFNRITLRRHGEEVDLCADLAVDESFVTTYNTPLEIIECT